jgi:hypothetical protein
MVQEVVFLPSTFEGMMEQFGINLKRKQLYEDYYKKQQEIEAMTKRRDVT